MYRLLILTLSSLLIGCIGNDLIDDRVPAQLRITNPIDSLAVGDAFVFSAQYLNEIGVAELPSITWISRQPEHLLIDETGQARGLSQGMATVVALAQGPDGSVGDSLTVVVGDRTSEPMLTLRSGTIQTTSSYVLTGSFTMREGDGDQVELALASDYVADDGLPGLYVYLTNNPNSIQNAHEIGAVEVFEGAHRYLLDASVELETYNYVLYYCKPFNVKVGDGQIQ